MSLQKSQSPTELTDQQLSRVAGGGSSPKVCPKCGSNLVDVAGHDASGKTIYGCRSCKHRWTV